MFCKNGLKRAKYLHCTSKIIKVCVMVEHVWLVNVNGCLYSVWAETGINASTVWSLSKLKRWMMLCSKLGWDSERHRSVEVLRLFRDWVKVVQLVWKVWGLLLITFLLRGIVWHKTSNTEKWVYVEVELKGFVVRCQCHF